MRKVLAWFGQGRRFGFRVYSLNLLAVFVVLLGLMCVGTPRIPWRIAAEDFVPLLIVGPILAMVIAVMQIGCVGIDRFLRPDRVHVRRMFSFFPAFIVSMPMSVMVLGSPMRPFNTVLKTEAPPSVRELRFDGMSNFIGDAEWVLSCTLAPHDFERLLQTHPYQISSSDEDRSCVESLSGFFVHVSMASWGQVTIYRYELNPDPLSPVGHHGTSLLATNASHDRLIGCYTSY